MKSVRNFYVAVTCVVMISMAIVGLSGLRRYDHGTGTYFGGWVVFASAFVGGGCLVFLGWHWLKLAWGITAIATGLEEHEDGRGGEGKGKGDKVSFLRPGSVVQCLEAVIGRRQEQYSESKRSLENQVKEIQLQVRLSERQKRNTEAIIYSIHDAVLVVDESNKLLMANEAAGELFGFDYQDCQHKAVDTIIGQGKGEFAEFLRRIRQSRTPAARQEMAFTEAEGPRIFDCIVSCVYDGRENVCGLVAVFHDITREKEISQTKNDFVSHVSHELKTPLASITAYSEMLADGEADDEETRKEFYKIIQTQAQRLNRLIEDILNVSRIESGLIKVDKKPLSLTILVEEQLGMIRSYAEEKHITVTGCAPIVYDQVYADKDMMSQVIVNLLSNAVKYTPSGGFVKVDMQVDESAGTVRVSVTDTGVGIPEADIGRLFGKFYRVEANKNFAKGTGLGLNLVKQIVEKVHNGRVFVTSRQGKGSTFGFELPLAATAKVESV